MKYLDKIIQEETQKLLFEAKKKKKRKKKKSASKRNGYMRMPIMGMYGMIPVFGDSGMDAGDCGGDC